MATIRRSGSGWQSLIRKKQYLGPRSKTFTSQEAAKLWANAVEGSLKKPEQLDQPPPQILKEAIYLFIEEPLQENRSGHKEQYPLRAMTKGDEILLAPLSSAPLYPSEQSISCANSSRTCDNSSARTPFHF